MAGINEILLEDLTKNQIKAVKSSQRRVLIVAGAGSGKTEVMARRIAWWIGIEKVLKKDIIAFTFTNRAAEEMKFRIRSWLEKITPSEEEVSLGGMYIGTIHGFCLEKIREYWPDDYHNFDILDEGARAALVLRGFHGLLGLSTLQNQIGKGQYQTLKTFLDTYDQLHEHNLFNVKLDTSEPPYKLGESEREWCRKAVLLTDVGSTLEAEALAKSASRYYAYLRCRRFLDFSTSQSEFIRKLKEDKSRFNELSSQDIHLVVDEVQDVNPIQRELINLLVCNSGRLTAVGDHRQSIYGFRGAKVEIIAKMWEEFTSAKDSSVIDLEENFRSTKRIIDLANCWATTISDVRSMKTAPMKHGNEKRRDQHESHVALVSFNDRLEEASSIAQAIRILVPSDSEGALHDKRNGKHRGLALSDIALLVRSATDMRTYMNALERMDIPCIVRAGPDLFSQPEILLFVAALAITANRKEFKGSQHNSKSLPKRIESVLGCEPEPKAVYKSAATAIRRAGLSFSKAIEKHLLEVSLAIRNRILDEQMTKSTKSLKFRSQKLHDFLFSNNKLRRLFPQQIFHMLLSEAEVSNWDTCEGRGQSALFHLGAMSSLITGIETPGWTSVKDYPWQIIGLFQFGAEEGRTEEQPLMVQPDAVTLSTIHGAKGLEYAAIFLADVNLFRFPSRKAKEKVKLPLSGSIIDKIDVAGLSENDNDDGERRLMYVALTRAERFLFISHSGKKQSKFIKELKDYVHKVGGIVTNDVAQILSALKYARIEYDRDIRIATSFSDLRYYLECPHDFYLRKVLGFSPTIDQAFGYGRGVHNIMRAIHSNPKKWSTLAKDRSELESQLSHLIEKGLFYLRYTTGAPAENMRKKGVKIAADYIQRYADELENLTFEPEKEFETLVEYSDKNGGALISGAIDIVRQDKPPRVTLVDFKSGDPDFDMHQSLAEEQMRLQVSLYAVAAKKELEYEPEQGIVRYLDSIDPKKSEIIIPFDDKSIVVARDKVARVAKDIKDRKFNQGPSTSKYNKLKKNRCSECDFKGICGLIRAD